jgi:hypothetical protein
MDQRAHAACACTNPEQSSASMRQVMSITVHPTCPEIIRDHDALENVAGTALCVLVPDDRAH